ncbi:hypothetical protein PVK06_005418 [Gossypium arboreum]|uniref:Secreted protein n=1 Tax=Gossypium arboreum TaxID=29729 RepID=A0ABR0QUJ9_GOSAR|nr:hypothetical protein PVK06_005418 [Gossypium arboreum]
MFGYLGCVALLGSTSRVLLKGGGSFLIKSAGVCWCLSSCFFSRAFELVPLDWLGGGSRRWWLLAFLAVRGVFWCDRFAAHLGFGGGWQ